MRDYLGYGISINHQLDDEKNCMVWYLDDQYEPENNYPYEFCNAAYDEAYDIIEVRQEELGDDY